MQNSQHRNSSSFVSPPAIYCQKYVQFTFKMLLYQTSGDCIVTAMDSFGVLWDFSVIQLPKTEIWKLVCIDGVTITLMEKGILSSVGCGVIFFHVSSSVVAAKTNSSLGC